MEEVECGEGGAAGVECVGGGVGGRFEARGCGVYGFVGGWWRDYE